ASIASRYGNRGQSDYAAANETLAKLAHELGRTWSCPVFAFDWGPWSEVGMGAELAKHMIARGVKMITPEDGQRFFADELEHGDGSREVIIAGGGENIASRLNGFMGYRF